MKLEESTIQSKLQVINCKIRHHWIVATSINCTICKVRVYYCIFQYCDEETKCIILNVFQCGPKKLSIKVAHSQKQKGSNDCGLFKLAFVTGFGKTNHNVTIDILRNTDLKY